MDYTGLDQSLRLPREVQDDTKKQEALTQAQLEREGQHKLWLEMPDTKAMLEAFDKAVKRVDSMLDIESATMTPVKIQWLLNQRTCIKNWIKAINTNSYTN